MLKLITPPTIEPVTLQQMKEYLRIDGTEYDPTLTALIRSGREAAESFQNRAYLTQTWELTLDTLPTMPIELPKPPLQEVIFMRLYDKDSAETTMDLTDFVIDGQRVAFKDGKTWPSVTLRSIGGFKLQFRAGYETVDEVPEVVKLAIRLFVSHRIDNPGSKATPDAFYNLLWPDRIVPV